MKKVITDENFEKEINKDKPVLVDFFATWCEPCSMLAPILERLAEHFKGKVILVKANIDSAPIAAQKFGVEKIPTVILFKNGKPVSGFVGLLSETAIKSWLENMLSDNPEK
jgi:thioredoxin